MESIPTMLAQPCLARALETPYAVSLANPPASDPAAGPIANSIATALAHDPTSSLFWLKGPIAAYTVRTTFLLHSLLMPWKLRDHCVSGIFCR